MYVLILIGAQISKDNFPNCHLCTDLKVSQAYPAPQDTTLMDMFVPVRGFLTTCAHTSQYYLFLSEAILQQGVIVSCLLLLLVLHLLLVIVQLLRLATMK